MNVGKMEFVVNITWLSKQKYESLTVNLQIFK